MEKIIQFILNIFGLQIKRIRKKKFEINETLNSHCKRFQHVYTNKPNNAQDDDFNWVTYNDHYRDELENIAKVHKQKLDKDDYIFENDVLVKKNDILPLHPNHRLLYETILLLNPSKVIEFGCGGGDHLYNLSILSPKIEINGLDRAEAQIDFCIKRSPSLKNKVQNFDITMPFSAKLPLVDISFTQAVIMHIKTGNGHLVALSNLFKVAANQVILLENWSSHPFLDDIKYLFENGMIPWENIHFYFRRAPEYNNKPYLIVISKDSLSMEKLTDYNILLMENM